MTYVLPRAFVILTGWGITCALIVKVWPGVDSAIFVVAGASWILAGLVCFGYMYKLRGEAEDRQSRFSGIDHKRSRTVAAAARSRDQPPPARFQPRARSP